MFKTLFVALTLAAGWTTVSNQEEVEVNQTTSPLPMLSLGAPEAPQDPVATPDAAPERLRRVVRTPKAQERTVRVRTAKPTAAQSPVKVRTKLRAPKAPMPAKVKVVQRVAENKQIPSDERVALLGEIRRLQEENNRLQETLQDKAERRRVMDRNSQQRDARVQLHRLKAAEQAAQAEHRAMEERARALEVEYRNRSHRNRAEQNRAAELAETAEITLRMNQESAVRLADKSKEARNAAEREADKNKKKVHEMAAAELLRAHGEQWPDGLGLDSEYVQDALLQIAENHGQSIEEAIVAQTNLWPSQLHDGDMEVHDIIFEIAEGSNHAVEKAARAELLEMLATVDQGGSLQISSAKDLEAVQEELEAFMERIECNNEDLIEGLELRLEGLEELCEEQEEACEELILRFEEEGGMGQLKMQLKGLDDLAELKNLAVLENLEGLAALEGLDGLAILGDLEGLEGLEGLAVLEQIGDLGAMVELQDLAELGDIQGLQVLFENTNEWCEEPEEECCGESDECCGEPEEVCEEEPSCCESESVPFLSSIPTIETLFEDGSEEHGIRVGITDDGLAITYSGDNEEVAEIIKGRILGVDGKEIGGHVILRSGQEIRMPEGCDASIRVRGTIDGTDCGDAITVFGSAGEGNRVFLRGENGLPTGTTFGVKTEGKLPSPTTWMRTITTGGEAGLWSTKAPKASGCDHCQETCGTSVIKIQNQGGQVFIDTHECKTQDSCDTEVNCQPAPSATGAPRRVFFSTGSPLGTDSPPTPCDPQAAPECADPKANNGVSMGIYSKPGAAVGTLRSDPAMLSYPQAKLEYTFASQARKDDPTLAELERMLSEVLREVDALQAEVDRVRVRVHKSEVR